MANRATDVISDPLTPVASDSDWEDKGWATESEALTAASHLEATISIRLDPESAALVRQAARRLGISKSEFVRRATVKEATEVIQRTERKGNQATT